MTWFQTFWFFGPRGEGQRIQFDTQMFEVGWNLKLNPPNIWMYWMHVMVHGLVCDVGIWLDF